VNSELFKHVYMAAVVVLAVATLCHLMKPKHMRPSGPTPDQTINPSWWSAGPLKGAKVGLKSNVISLGL
jgi:hypothetical protein